MHNTWGIIAQQEEMCKDLIHLVDQQTQEEEELLDICDFRRCRLNVRSSARIQPLLPGHKYQAVLLPLAVFGLIGVN